MVTIDHMHHLCLTTHNWQNWKGVFLTCYCHEIYKVEEVGPNNSKYTLKITIFVNMWTLGQFVLKNRYFANNCLIKVQIWEFFFTHVTHITLVIFCTANFVLVNYKFPFQILRCLAQNYSKIGFLRKCFKKSKHPLAFLHKTKGSNNSFTLIEKQFHGFKIA